MSGLVSRAPGLLVLTDRRRAQAAGHTLEWVVEAAVRGGARTVLLREKDLPATDRLRLARRLRAVLEPAGGRLLVASDAVLARRAGAAGVHLARDEPHPGPSATGGGLVVGRSCHDVAELAGARGADYVTLSPVYPTASKPGYGPALGVAGLAGVLRAVPGHPPVVALGGITADRAGACRRAGADGVAVLGAVMGATAPQAVVAALLAAMADTGQDDGTAPSNSTTG